MRITAVPRGISLLTHFTAELLSYTSPLPAAVMDCTATPAQSHTYTNAVTTGTSTTLTFSQADNGTTLAVVPSRHIRLYKKYYGDVNCAENVEKSCSTRTLARGTRYPSTMKRTSARNITAVIRTEPKTQTRGDELPFDDEEDESCRSDSDYDYDPALGYYSEDEIECLSNEGLAFDEIGGFWYKPGGGYYCDPKRIVFEDK